MGPRGITNLGLQRIVFMDTLLRYSQGLLY